MFVWFVLGLVSFAFHLFSYKLRIVDRLQNVDDRQSLERARHGLKKKNHRFTLSGITRFWVLFLFVLVVGVVCFVSFLFDWSSLCHLVRVSMTSIQTATIVMMSAAMEQKKTRRQLHIS